MANVFTDYFDNISNILKEKNAWYRVLTFIVISVLYQFSIQVFCRSIHTELNVPAFLLSVLSFLLLIGFGIQVMSNRMNKIDKFIPEIDFVKMFMAGLKSIPFLIVWGLYIILISMIFGLLFALLIGLLGALHFPKLILVLVAMVTVLPVAILLFAPCFSVYAMFSKNLSYQHILNPMLYFKLFPKTATKILAAYIAAIIAIIALGVIAYVIHGFFSGMTASLQPEAKYVLMTVAGLIVGYLYQVASFALSCSIADITQEATKGMYDNNDNKKDTKDDSSSNDIIDKDYSSYMRNDDDK